MLPLLSKTCVLSKLQSLRLCCLSSSHPVKSPQLSDLGHLPHYPLPQNHLFSVSRILMLIVSGIPLVTQCLEMEAREDLCLIISADFSTKKMTRHSAWLGLYGFGVTKLDRSWGIPLLSSCTTIFTSTYPLTTNAKLSTDDYLPRFGKGFLCRYRSESGPPPSLPLTNHGLSMKLYLPESLNPRQAPPPCFTLFSSDWRTELAPLPSVDSSRPFAQPPTSITGASSQSL